MEISASTPAVGGDALAVVIQSKVLDALKAQAAEVANMIASGPQGSANFPHQGRFIDAHA